MAPTDELFKHPLHPYTQALMSAIPVTDKHSRRKRTILEGTVPSPIDPPTGCRFHPRCYRMDGDHCRRYKPEWQEGGAESLDCLSSFQRQESGGARMKPIIGINMSTRRGQNAVDDVIYLREVYVKAVVRAGGVPVLLPLVASPSFITGMISQVDGLLMSGGGGGFSSTTNGIFEQADVLPELTDLMAQHPRRHVFDLTLCRLALKRNLPILGICRGHQTLNEAAGGTLVLDLAAVTCEHHRQQGPGDTVSHRIMIQKHSRLEQMIAPSPAEQWVNSFHRQAVDRPAPDFIASSFSPDGVIESIESHAHDFAVGIQFHPELMMETNSALGKVYASLVDAARVYREAKQLHVPADISENESEL